MDCTIFPYDQLEHAKKVLAILKAETNPADPVAHEAQIAAQGKVIARIESGESPRYQGSALELAEA